jgi:hypothetical protein
MTEAIGHPHRRQILIIAKALRMIVAFLITKSTGSFGGPMPDDFILIA